MKRLSIDSATYKRRMVRELNAEAQKGNGFYWGGHRCHKAAFKGGVLMVLDITGEWHGNKPGEMVRCNEFADVYGREIVASTVA